MQDEAPEAVNPLIAAFVARCSRDAAAEAEGTGAAGAADAAAVGGGGGGEAAWAPYTRTNHVTNAAG
jgi:hypothetical protein